MTLSDIFNYLWYRLDIIDVVLWGTAALIGVRIIFWLVSNWEWLDEYLSDPTKRNRLERWYDRLTK